MPFARANPSAASTNENLIPSRSGTRVKVRSVYVSSDTEMVLTIVNADTHTIVWRMYVGANGGAFIPVSFWSAMNEGLDYTTSATGNVMIIVEYNRF